MCGGGGHKNTTMASAGREKKGVKEGTFLLIQLVVEVLLALGSWRAGVKRQPLAFPVGMVVEECPGEYGENKKKNREKGEVDMNMICLLNKTAKDHHYVQTAIHSLCERPTSSSNRTQCSLKG